VHWASLNNSEVLSGVTSRARTVIDCARSYDLDVALAVADSALREGVLGQDELKMAAARSPRTGRARAVRIADIADARAANPFESVVRAHALTVQGLRLEPQGAVPGVGWVDLLDSRLGIAVEADSFGFHANRAALSRDVRRYTDCTRLGLLVVRFTWEEAMFDPAHVHAALSDVVNLRLSHGYGSWSTGGGDRSVPAWPDLELPG
jgi:very-short-patch-repair endonuclease